MKALVLSAGYGERLRPLTDQVPKPLLDVGGRPLIHYPLLMLRAAGIRDVAINVHHLGASIENALGDGRALGIAISYSPEPTLRGTGGPLLALRDYLADAPFIVLNCDTIIDLDLARIMAFHREHGALATLVLRTSGEAESYSRIEIDTASRIRRLRLLAGRARGESSVRFTDYPKILSDELEPALTPYMYCGVMICEPAILASMPLVPPFGLISDLLAPLIAHKLMGFVYEGFFRTVDDLAGYQALHMEFAAGAPPLTFLPAANPVLPQ
jgi:mannose-1-phosphate guanylyltransferase